MSTNDASEEVGAAMPARPPRENLVRATPGIELRDTGSGMPTLTGHFAVWNQWTEIRSAYEGNFLERFAPTSMSKTLSESTPKVLFQHGKDPQLGDKPLGTVRSLTPDDVGAFYEVDMLDTSYNRDLIPGLQAGLYGASFRFSVVHEDVDPKPARSDYNPRGIPERTVQEARVMEFGPVTFPAYANATAGIRSMTDEFLFDALAENPERLRELWLRTLRSPSKTPLITLPLATNSSGGGITINYTPAVTGAIPLRDDEPREDLQEDEPDLSEDTTRQIAVDHIPDEPGVEPEPPEATTRSTSRDLFKFTEPPKHLKASE